jgi:hypothetical protein
MSRQDGRGWWERAVAIALGIIAGTVAAAGTLAVAVAGFTLSYDAIRAVGKAAHIRAEWAWLLPVSIDGAMAVASVAAVVLHRLTGRTAWYPWGVVVAGALISVGCNGLHSIGERGKPLELDPEVRFAVSAIPAVMLALSVHLLVLLVDVVAGKVAPVGHREAARSAIEVPAMPAVPIGAASVPVERQDRSPAVAAEVAALVPVSGGPAGTAASDSEARREEAREMYRLSVSAGDPLSGAALGRNYGMSERWGRDRVAEVKRAEVREDQEVTQ